MISRGRPISMFRDFLQKEATAGIVLMAAAGLALLVANSPLAPAYFGLQHTVFAGLDLLHWINDGLMAVFFLLIGLEVKREILQGELSTWPRRILPGIAALGGMVMPALIYVVVTGSNPEMLRGWAIPMATDIAFALGVLALLGSRVPLSLKVFLTAVAVIDDLGAVMVIALFYTADLSLPALALAGLVLLALIGLNRFGLTRLPIYLILGLVLWVCVLRSGVHATLAGVALALTIPIGRRQRGSEIHADSPLHRLEHALHPWVAFLILPIFGFANSGVSFAGMSPAALLAPVPLGIAMGLFIGKQLGVFGFAWLAVRTGYANLPARATWMQLYAISLLCGIGFTMSLFIGTLAFLDSPDLIVATKLGVLGGSLVSAVTGWVLLRLGTDKPIERRP
jgi:Na+:H+ antiporter, NhaA family